MSSLDVFLAVVFWISVFSLSLSAQPEPEFRPPMSEVVQALLRLLQRANLSKQQAGENVGRSRNRSLEFFHDSYTVDISSWKTTLPPSLFFSCKNLQVYVCMYVFWFGFKNRPFSTRRFFRVDYLMMLIAKVGIKRLVKTLPSNWMVSPIWRAMYVMKFLL